jgi:hypothetical protein
VERRLLPPDLRLPGATDEDESMSLFLADDETDVTAPDAAPLQS